MNLDKIIKVIEQKNPTNKTPYILFLTCLAYKLDPNFVIISDVAIQNMSKWGLIRRNSVGQIKLLNQNLEEVISDVDKYLEEYRNVFKDLFTGSMGSPKAVRKKLLNWLEENPQYDMQDIIKAAHYWVDNKKREVSNPNLIGQADYFISKKVDGVETSRLLSIIDEAINNFEINEEVI